MRVDEHVPLAPLTTLGIGGPARYLITAETEEEIPPALARARELQLPWLVLGGGSNLLVHDRGFPGVVVRPLILGRQSLEGGMVAAGAGEDWDGLVAWCVARGLAGIECLSGIPGSVGATPVQNVGAYGQEIAESFEKLRAWDNRDQRWVELAGGDCGFGYRASRFNREDRERFVITRVWLRLRPGGPATVRYPELARSLDHGRNDAAPGLREVREGVLELRRSKAMLFDLADPDARSAGSFFKNPVVTASLAQAIEVRAGRKAPSFPVPGGVKIPAAWLLEQAGFHKGYHLAGSRVGLSHRHILAIVNRGGGSADEVVALTRHMRAAVAERFRVQLEPEPVWVGFERGEGMLVAASGLEPLA